MLNRDNHLLEQAAKLFQEYKVFYASGNYTEALDHLDAAIKLDPSSFIFLEAKINLLLNLRRYQDALNTCELGLSLRPKHKSFLLAKSSLLFLLEKFELSLHFNEQLAQMMHKNSDDFYQEDVAIIMNTYCVTLLRLGRFREAADKNSLGFIEKFSRHVSYSDHFKNFMINAGAAFYFAGRFNDAMIHLMDIPNNTLYGRYLFARSIYFLGNDADAAKHFDHIISLKPSTDVRDICIHSLALVKRFKSAEALNELNRLELLNTGATRDPFFFLAKAEALFAMDRLDQAEKHLIQCLKMWPLLPDAIFSLGRVLFKQGRMIEAHDCFKRALVLRPEDPDAKEYLLLSVSSITSTAFIMKPLSLDDQRQAQVSDKKVAVESPPTLPKEFTAVDVPHDHNCLFWSTALGLLLPTLNDRSAFNKMFALLFGQDEHYFLLTTEESIATNQPSVRDRVYHILATYDCQKDTPIQFVDTILTTLVCGVFRNRVVDHMTGHFNDEEFKQYHAKENNRVDWDAYLNAMRKSKEWAGHPEMVAISQLTQTNFLIHTRDAKPQPCSVAGAKQTLHLIHTHADELVTNKNHYQFGLPTQLYSDMIKNKRAAQQVEEINLQSNNFLFRSLFGDLFVEPHMPQQEKDASARLSK